MKRLVLLRHAKAEPAGSGIDDRKRELLPRGRDDSSAMGKHLARRNIAFDLILSSSARRSVDTLERICGQLPATQRIEILDALYLAAPRELLATIRSVAENVKTLMLIGHNPGVEQLAASLAREPVKRKERDYFDLIGEKFPTGAMVVLDFSLRRWRDIGPSQGKLIDFVRPRDL